MSCALRRTAKHSHSKHESKKELDELHHLVVASAFHEKIKQNKETKETTPAEEIKKDCGKRKRYGTRYSCGYCFRTSYRRNTRRHDNRCCRGWGEEMMSNRGTTSKHKLKRLKNKRF